MKKLLKNIILSIIATLIYVTLTPISLIFTIIKISIKNKDNMIEILSNIFFNHAQGIDQTGNGVFYILFNSLFIKDDTIHPFGSVDETISSVLGVNKLKNNLTLFGKFLDFILSLIDDNHTIKSIGN
jgi:hypothetical protein